MCEKKPYCARRVDPCIAGQVDAINGSSGGVKTVLSCCGHGVYQKSIITKDRLTGEIREFFSGVKLADKPRKSGKYYKRDADGYYYIPEVVAFLNGGH